MSIESRPDEKTVMRTAPTAPLDERFPSSDEPEAEWESTVRKDIMVGQRIGEYVVRRRIGAGGMGVVYEGEHPVIGRKVAIKIIRPDSSEGIRSRDLVSEARAVSAIRHRGIIDIFGFGTLPGIGQYLVMEYLNGRPLDEVILDRAPMPPSEAIRLMVEVLGALSAAHAVGVIHRDLKPGNIFVVLESNGTEYVKVLDFGLAKQGATPNGPTPQTRASMIVGTPEYMAPEQACGQPVSPRTDLYAVGIILFEMLTGRLPFRGDSPMHVAIQQVQAQPPAPASLVDGLPAELNELVLRLLAKEPEQRPASAEAVARELKTIARTLAVDMTQLSGFARAVPEPEPEPAAAPVAPAPRPAPRQEAPVAPPRTARPPAPPAPPPAETVEAPRVITGSRPAVPPPDSDATAVERPGARPAPVARPQAARPQVRPQAAAPRTPPTTDVIPVQVAPDTAEIAPVGSRSLLKPLMGVGLAAVLMGVVVGVVVHKGDSDPAVTPVPATGPKPQPTLPDPRPKVENPPQSETQPTASTVATTPDSAPQKAEPDSAQENATSEETARSPEEPGFLRLQAKCWGTVFIDGKPRGRAPMSTPIQLPPGIHKLELRNNPSREYEANVVIRPAETTKHVAYCRPRSAG